MKEALCQNCQAICCQDAILYLTPVEVEFLTEAGTVLTPLEDMLSEGTREQISKFEFSIVEVQGLGSITFIKGDGEPNPYALSGKCGYLQNEEDWISCSANKNPNRPRACATAVVAGDKKCLIFRENRGID